MTRDTNRYWRTSADSPMASLPQEACRRPPVDADEPLPLHPTGCRLQREDKTMKDFTAARLRSSNCSDGPSPGSISVPGSISGPSASASSSPAASGRTKTRERKEVSHLPSGSVSSVNLHGTLLRNFNCRRRLFPAFISLRGQIKRNRKSLTKSAEGFTNSKSRADSQRKAKFCSGR